MSISLNQQIEGVNREIIDLKGERHVHERKRGYNKREYDYQIARLRAALSTLYWVQANETAIRNAVEGKS